VILVNETMARQLWSGEDPIGKRVTFDAEADTVNWFTVVGVVGDVRPRELRLAPRPQIFLPHLQNPWPALSLVVRMRGDPEQLVPALRREAASLDPLLPLGDVRTLEEVLDRAVAQPRFQTYLLSAFAGLALLLAAVGIYGVVSFSVSQRTREIGVRMALGALPTDVVRHFVRMGLRPVLLGLALGLVASLVAVRLLSGLLYEVPHTDPVTFVAVPAILVAVAALAALLPARRATRVDPMVTLRAE
jgi:putative ABC transport system permease protein